MRTNVASRQDTDRVLQGQPEAGQSLEPKVRLSRLHFPAETGMNRWGKTFVNFSPGIANRAAQAIRQTMRDWQLDCRIDKRIDDLAKMFNPIIRGWINYYGRYHKSALSRALMH